MQHRPQPIPEDDFWRLRGEQQSEANRHMLPQGWQPPAFNQHYNSAERVAEIEALNARVQEVAQTPMGGIWKGLRLPPGSRFRPQREQMVNGSEPQQDVTPE